MNKVKLSLFALAAIFAVSCVQDPTMEASKDNVQVSVAKKIINTAENAVAGELVLYVDEATADMWAAAETVTRSGNVQLDAVAAELGAESIEPVFNMNINGAEKRAQGMHRWYVVKFDQETNLQSAAEKYASMKEVDRVQFSTMMTRPQVTFAPAPEVAATRADAEVPFNDPMLELQWHYDNQGLKSIYPDSREGEDINAFAAWEYTAGNSDIIVAVMDEGVKYDHPDLAANMWTNDAELNGAPGVDDDGNGVIDDVYGYNCVDENGNISWNVAAWKTVDGKQEYAGDTGHGTHVAGTVAAVNNNGIGVAGVAGGSGNGDGVRIMSIQIFDGDGNTSFRQNAKGMEYAADMGACILQNSWGYPTGPNSDAIYETGYGVELAGLNYFVKASGCKNMTGNVAIFAAGNYATPYADYPGAYNKFIAVTAYAPDGLPTSYTNYGSGCNVAAPGGDLWVDYEAYEYRYEGCVLSTVPAETYDYINGTEYGTDYGYMQGTSMACPHVSGIAALALSYAVDNGITLTNTELYDVITSSVRNIDNQLKGQKVTNLGSMSLDGYKGKMGTGKIDALMAIMNVRGTICVPAIVGQELELSASMVVGNGDITVTGANGYEMSDETKNRLGIEKIDVFAGKLYFTCKKAGIGIIKVQYIAGGNKEGGGDTTGGKLMEKEVVLVVRDVNDNGGWL